MQYSYVYILASQRNGTLYIGVTSDLPKRIYQHRTAITKGFTHKYNVHNLVWFEQHEDIVTAIEKEKKLKKYNRKEKLQLIELLNPEWHDLYDSILG